MRGPLLPFRSLSPPVLRKLGLIWRCETSPESKTFNFTVTIFQEKESEHFETHRQRSVYKISKVFCRSDEHPLVPVDEATEEAGTLGHDVKGSEQAKIIKIRLPSQHSLWVASPSHKGLISSPQAHTARGGGHLQARLQALQHPQDWEAQAFDDGLLSTIQYSSV